MIVYLIGMTIVAGMLIYITITDEELHTTDEELIVIMFIMTVLTLGSWVTVLMYTIHSGLKYIRDK